MKIQQLTHKLSRSKKRVGRGIGSGTGKTAGRGTKGQLARTGKKLRPGFEGGQNPLMQRLPKQPGFTSMRRPIQNVQIDQLNRFKEGEVISPLALQKAGLIKDSNQAVKILNRGQLSKKLVVEGITLSKTAAVQLKKQGGSIRSLQAQPPQKAQP